MHPSICLEMLRGYEDVRRTLSLCIDILCCLWNPYFSLLECSEWCAQTRPTELPRPSVQMCVRVIRILWECEQKVWLLDKCCHQGCRSISETDQWLDSLPLSSSRLFTFTFSLSGAFDLFSFHFLDSPVSDVSVFLSWICDSGASKEVH